jgi:hypothetical protein
MDAREARETVYCRDQQFGEAKMSLGQSFSRMTAEKFTSGPIIFQFTSSTLAGS